MVNWNKKFPDYQPVEYEHEKLATAVWADPFDVNKISDWNKGSRVSYRMG